MKITQIFGANDNSKLFQNFALECFENGTTILQDGSILTHTARGGKNILTLQADGRLIAEAEVTLMGMEPAWQVWGTIRIGFDGASAAHPVETYKTFVEAIEAAERIEAEKTYHTGAGNFPCEFSHIQKIWA